MPCYKYGTDAASATALKERYCRSSAYSTSWNHRVSAPPTWSLRCMPVTLQLATI